MFERWANKGMQQITGFGGLLVVYGYLFCFYFPSVIIRRLESF